MTTTPITGTNSSKQVKSSKAALNADDFIKMMVTQLQNQDPLDPAKNSELLAQMSQIGQLQTATQMQDMLKNLAMQTSLGSAGGMIGKMVKGLDDNGAPLNGLVSSVKVQGSDVMLELDNGSTLKMTSVTDIAPAAASTSVPH